MNKDKLAALVTAVGLTFMKSSRPQNCLASRKLNSIWNLRAVIIDQILAGQFQIAAEQDDVRPGLGAQVGFDDDDHIERLREIRVEELDLIDAGLDIILHGSIFEITLRNGADNLLVHRICDDGPLPW